MISALTLLGLSLGRWFLAPSPVVVALVVGAVVLYEGTLQQQAPKDDAFLNTRGIGKYMSNQGPPFNASSIVKQMRAFSGYMPGWIQKAVPNSCLQTPDHADKVSHAVRDFIADSQRWETERYTKNGYRLILPNNRKVIFVRG